MADVTSIVRRGTSTIYDVYYDDGTAQTIYSSGTPDPHSTIPAPFDIIGRSGQTLQAFDDFGIGNKVNLPLSLYDGAGNLVKSLTGVDDVAPVRRARIALAGGTDTGAGIGVWVQPELVNVAIEHCIIRSTHISSAACTLDAGVTVASAITVADNLIDGLNLAVAVPDLSSNLNAANQDGSNATKEQFLAAGGWVTFSTASGASAGFTGFAYIFYRLLD